MLTADVLERVSTGIPLKAELDEVADMLISFISTHCTGLGWSAKFLAKEHRTTVYFSLIKINPDLPIDIL